MCMLNIYLIVEFKDCNLDLWRQFVSFENEKFIVATYCYKCKILTLLKDFVTLVE